MLRMKVSSVNTVPTRTTPAETHVHPYLPYGSQQAHQGTYPPPGQRPRGHSLDSGTVLASSPAGHISPPLTDPAAQRQALGLGAGPASGSTPPVSVRLRRSLRLFLGEPARPVALCAAQSASRSCAALGRSEVYAGSAIQIAALGGHSKGI
ncbi:hypothetical protein JB92DRAFT_2815292 [Gautieria morchelliformis]|nr:hypothetical protein JB92DRAFT_2815292 [Gautieria morchelliformis]